MPVPPSFAATSHDTARPMSRAARPEELLRPEVLDVAPYQVPDATGLIKLDAMENPYPLPADLAGEWARQLGGIALHRYPDAAASALKSALRDHFGIGGQFDLLPGNGSDEIIQLLTLALARPGAVAMACEPSFVMYRRCAQLAGMRYAGVTLREDFSLPVDHLLARIDAERPALIFIAQPNNPTGNLCDREWLERIASAAPGLVVIDEAYHAFSGADSLSLLRTHGNVLVMRTLSKLGLAGLRIGFLVGRPEWIGQLEKVRMPYNVGVLAQTAGAFLLHHGAAFAAQAARIRSDRELLYGALVAMPGVIAWPSAANFILFRVRGRQARDVHRNLLDAGVLIKNLDGVHPLLRDCLRVTVGTAAENAAFLAVLRQSLAV